MSREFVARAHLALREGNLTDPSLQRVRPLVRLSWERSWGLGVAVDTMPVAPELADGFPMYRQAHPLTAVMPMLRGLLLPGSSDDSLAVLGVCDHNGTVLWVEGDRSVRAITDQIGYVVGSNWSEAVAGTNAPGTALVVGHTVQISGAEHFNRLAHLLSCTAAPVRDPESNRILGVVTVTGGPEATTPQARLLLEAAARAAEAEILVTRLRQRAAQPTHHLQEAVEESAPIRLRVLGVDLARLEIPAEGQLRVVELTARHGAIMLMLAVHRQGVSAERLAELVYGEGASKDTLRPEMVRLRKTLERTAPSLVPESRPYRLLGALDTDAHDLLAQLDRGSYRAALKAYVGPVLPESVAPGVEDFRNDVRGALREVMISEASLDVLLAYSEIPEGAEDAEVLRLCLEMLPARSPRRAGIVARIEKLEDPVRPV